MPEGPMNEAMVAQGEPDHFERVSTMLDEMSELIDKLPSTAEHNAVLAERNALRAQRDELLAALQSLLSCCEAHKAFSKPGNRITAGRMKAARAAIAKCEAAP